MKAKILSFVCFVLFIEISCLNSGGKNILGSWENQSKFQSEFEFAISETAAQEVVATIQLDAIISFSEDGNVVRTVKQKVLDVQAEQYLMEREGLLAMFRQMNMTTEAFGKYRVKGDILSISFESVSVDGGERQDYKEFFADSITDNPAEFSLPISVNENSLVIGDIEFTAR